MGAVSHEQGTPVSAVEGTRHTQKSQGQIPALAWAIFPVKVFKIVSVVPCSLASGRTGACFQLHLTEYIDEMVLESQLLHKMSTYSILLLVQTII